jgi:hypothetical protein
MSTRRGFLRSLGAVLATPALAPVTAKIVALLPEPAVAWGQRNGLLTLNMITKEAVVLFRNSNAFINKMNAQFEEVFGENGPLIGEQLRIRLPNEDWKKLDS